MKNENEYVRYYLTKTEVWVFSDVKLKRLYESGQIKDQIVEAWDFTIIFSGEKIDTLLISDIF